MDKLEQLRQRVLDGDKSAILGAMYLCVCVRKTAVPEWLNEAFSKAYEDVSWARAGSWDDVFGRPWPKGKHLKQLNKRLSLALPVWHVVTMAQIRGEPVDERLFEWVGKGFGIGKTVANDLYYATRRRDGVKKMRQGMLRLVSRFLPPNL